MAGRLCRPTLLGMTEIARLENVTRRYDGGPQPALDGVNLALAQGAIIAIMGPSGSGKSTLLNIVGGIDRPTSGTVTVAGTELTRLSEAALARHRRTQVGIIFQFFNLLNNLSALDNVLLPTQLGGSRRTAGRVAAMDLLDRLGIATLADRYPAQLSGGERQRVAIARALVNQPALLLADEPTGALDSHSGGEVLDILADLNRAGQTIVLVTHDQHLAETYADEVVQLVDGAIVAAAPVAVAGGGR
jgi:putative ABC transport system ATP-binding protein